ncbi:hypothetical protein GGI12_001993 [Dipsacomyces acuminosporus]|nr:hypothetical protein GGI12_001993 [Dipsacomyces acuminosporus]
MADPRSAYAAQAAAAAAIAATPTPTQTAGGSTLLAQAASALAGYAAQTAAPLHQRADTYNPETIQTVDINASLLFGWGNIPGTGPYFSANYIDAATQISSAALMGGACILVFSLLRYRWPELYSHRLRLRFMRPANIPRTLFGWIYPVVTMSDRHVFETSGLDSLLFFRAYRMFIYLFVWMSFFGMSILYPVNFFWGREEGDTTQHSIFDSPLSHVKDYRGKYSVPHVFLAYIFAIILFFYIDRFALHCVTMRWHYLLLTRRSGNSRTLMVTSLPRDLRSELALTRFINGMKAGEVESVHVAPMTRDLDDALKHRVAVLTKLEKVYSYVLGNPCRARSYDPLLLRRIVLSNDPRAREAEAKLLRRWARRHKGDHKTRLRTPVQRPTMHVKRAREERPEWSMLRRIFWPYERVDSILHLREELAKADKRLKEVRDNFHALEASPVAFVTMTKPEDAYIISQLNVYATPNTCKIQMAPEARSIVWRSVGAPYSKKLLRYILGLIWTVVLLCVWCVPVALLATLVSLRFLVTRFDGLAHVVEHNKFVRSLLNYTLPSLILTIFMTILPRLLWNFVLIGGDRGYGIADKNMLIRHFYFLCIYIVFILGMSGSVWSSIYDVFTNFGDFWHRLINEMPQMATWYCVYVMLYGAGYQVMKLLHLKSVCRFLWHQANANTPREYMKAISPVFIDWGTIQPYPMLFFFIGITYAHLQPLLLAMCILYFGIGLFVMKYMCMYAWHFRQQNAGSLWPVIIRRLVACIFLYQLITTAIFSSNENRWFVAPMVVLMLFTWYYFWVRCIYIKQLSCTIPLQLLREADRRRRAILAKERKEFKENERKAEQDLLSAKSSPGARSSVAWADLHTTTSRASSQSAESDSPNTTASSANYPPLHAVLVTNDTTPSPPPPANEKDAAGTEYGEQQLAGESDANAEDAEDADGNTLVIKRKHVKHTHSWYRATIHNMFVHPIQALISSVSSFLWWMHGDPAAPLWDFIDDYAFPERVNKLSHPAGRSPYDPRMPKEQPRSLVEIILTSFKKIPNGMRNIKGEFFMDFDIPRAHLDSSMTDIPETTFTEDAFEKRRRHRHRHHDHQHTSGYESGDQLSPIGSTASDAYASDSMNHCLAPQELPDSYVARIREHISKSAGGEPSGSDEKQRLLSPGASVPRPFRKATPFIADINPCTGKPVAMQYQLHSDEIPHGTKMNRRYTDFSQPNMSRLPGVLDSTRFSYLHPGIYGDLPSLWLPVAHLKRRKQMKRSAKERLREVRDRWEDAVESNILGEKAFSKIHEKYRSHKTHPRVRALSDTEQKAPHPLSAASSPTDSDADSDIGTSAAGDRRTHKRTLSKEEARKKADDLAVANKCSEFGIDPALLRQWDPTGMHSCQFRNRASGEGSVVSGYTSDAVSTYDGAHDDEGLSGSESDNIEGVDDVDGHIVGSNGLINTSKARDVEEGRM